MEALGLAQAALRYGLQYPLPIITAESTESGRIWQQHLIDRRAELQALGG